ncbi:MAG: hypothetical protein JO124_20555 [Hyphomicrobiales bacterium]|nr:hypothetical protein [Hyphomicrobiales bacterium]
MQVSLPALTQDEPHPGLRVLAVIIIALIALFTAASLLAPVTGQSQKHADGTIDIPVGP